MTLYWVLMALVPVPGCGAGSFTVDCNFARWIDSILLEGHMWSRSKTWDPEGIVSTLPAVGTTMLGVFAGQILALVRTQAEKATWLFLCGNALMLGGTVLSLAMPVNKQLWTVPYALLMAGIAYVVFAGCYWLIDVLGWNRFARPFAIYGVNALAVYVLSGLFARLLSLIPAGDSSLRTAIWRSVFEPLSTPANSSLLFAFAHVLLFWAIAWIMHRKDWIVRV
jgi:predicted acyltransferase